MGDLWDDEALGSGGATLESDGDDDWDEGDESLDTSVEDGFDNPDALEGDGSDEDEE